MIQKTRALKNAGFIVTALLLAVLLFSGCPQLNNNGPENPELPESPEAPENPENPENPGQNPPAEWHPVPSVIRGDGELSAGWAGEAGVQYEVWYSGSADRASAVKWAGTVSGGGAVNGAVIGGLSNGNTYHVWIKTVSGEAAGDFSAGTPGIPEAPKTVPADFVYVPGGTIGGSDAYGFTLTIPNNPVYTNPGSSALHRGVFAGGRVLAIDSFAMAKYETTRQLWYEVQVWAEGQGYAFQNRINAPAEGSGNRPITNINWRDAVVWCNAWSEKSNLDPVYRDSGGGIIKDSRNGNKAACNGALMDRDKNGFRLPTEAEREFAARGGDPGRADWMFMYAGSSDADTAAWHHGNAPYTLHDTGGKAANRLGIYDLSGNAQEWGWDWMKYDVPVTPETPAEGAAYSSQFSQKPMAGGGAGSNVTLSCVAHRWGFDPDYKHGFVGFRPVRRPD